MSQSVKQQVRKMLEHLPDTVTYEDVQYHLYIMQKVLAGDRRAEEEGTLTQDEVERQMAEWLKE